MKNSNLLLIGIFAFILISSGALSGVRSDVQSDLDDWIDFDFFGSQGTGGVGVNRKIDFSLIDQYGGSSLNSKTLKLYDSNGKTLLETLTTDGSDGTALTTNPYASGKTLYVYYESTNDKQWFTVIVPEMYEADIDASANNNYRLDAFTIGTYTTDELEYDGSTDLADASTYNMTDSGETPTFTYTLQNSGSDNTGLKSSYDPLYEMDFDVVFYISFSGTGYEKVLPYSFPYDYTLGTTHYVAQTIDPYKLTRHKEGFTFKSAGNEKVTWWCDLSALSGSDSVTMQIYVKAYSDASWHQTHGGNYGYEVYEIAEHTVTLTPNG